MDRLRSSASVEAVHVLLVEDDEDDYILVRDLLHDARGFPFTLDWVQTYDAALAAIAATVYDALLVDYRLGTQSGFDLLMLLREREVSTPIIMLTGQGDYETDLRAMDAGAADYLAKGQLNAERLERVLRYAIRHRQTLAALRESTEQLRAQYQGFPIPTFTWQHQGEDWVFIQYNDAAHAMTNGMIGDQLGKGVRTLYRDHPDFLAAFAKCADTGQIVEQDLTWTFATGETRDLSIRLVSVRGDLIIMHIEDVTQRRRADEALRERERQLAAQFQGNPIPMYTWQRQGEDWVLIDYNKAAHAITRGAVAQSTGTTLRTMYRDRPEVRESFARCVGGEEHVEHEMEYTFRPSGERKDLFVTYVLAAPDLILVHTEDVTARMQAAAALERQNAYLAALHDVSLSLLNRRNVVDVLQTVVQRAAALLGVPNGYISLPTADGMRLEFVVGIGIFDAKGYTLTRRGEGLSGTVWERREPVVIDDHRQWSRAVKGPHSSTMRAAAAVPLISGEIVTGVLGLASTEEGRIFDAEAVTLLERFAQLASIALDNARLYEQTQQELRERQEAESALRHNATHDALTGLANRPHLMERIEHTLVGRKRGGTTFAVLFLDLDRFKHVNDSLGHSHGDALLVSIADRLRACLPAGAILGRLGGDEFAVLMEGIAGAEEAVQLAERMQAALDWPFKLRGHEVYVVASIGIALGGGTNPRPEDLLRDADIAMYRAKNNGGARFAVFDAAMHADAVGRLELENDLRRAIERDELKIHYQPIVSLATDTITGFEALARWDHPRRGSISPAEFIAIAEDTGMIVALDRRVLREACRQMHAWHSTGTSAPPLTISVNVSGKHLARPDFVEHILQTLGETGLDAHTLNLEITESVLVEHTDTAASALRQLSAAGVHIHLDDFGVGYSSLNYLRRFPIDTLKIDRSFIEEGIDGANAAIIGGTVAIAHQLGIRVIAEGIETPPQSDRLRELACDGGQGFLFSPPLNASRATHLVHGGHTSPEEGDAPALSMMPNTRFLATGPSKTRVRRTRGVRIGAD